jgi:hypothetical protein
VLLGLPRAARPVQKAPSPAATVHHVPGLRLPPWHASSPSVARRGPRRGPHPPRGSHAGAGSPEGRRQTGTIRVGTKPPAGDGSAMGLALRTARLPHAVPAGPYLHRHLHALRAAGAASLAEPRAPIAAQAPVEAPAAAERGWRCRRGRAAASAHVALSSPAARRCTASVRLTAPDANGPRQGPGAPPRKGSSVQTVQAKNVRQEGLRKPAKEPDACWRRGTPVQATGIRQRARTSWVLSVLAIQECSRPAAAWPCLAFPPLDAHRPVETSRACQRARPCGLVPDSRLRLRL